MLEPINNNTAPVANAGGPYSVHANESIVLDASRSFDREQENETLTYQWDLDGDGDYDDASGITTTFSALDLNGPLTTTVSVAVTDVEGLTNSDSATLLILKQRHMLSLDRVGDGRGYIYSRPAGLDCGITCTAPFVEDSTITLTAKVHAGSIFGGWGGACESETTTTCSVLMDDAQSVIAIFDDKPGPGFDREPLNSPAADSKIIEEKITFDWDGAFNNEGEAPIERYTIIVTVTLATEPAQISPINQVVTYTFVTTDTTFTPDIDFPLGEYTWTVVATDGDGLETQVEEAFAFTRQEAEPPAIFLPFVWDR
ncbi:MAG: PKD domain-containing protein [Chloroflexota bacterium]